ncbi:hypothetical protein HK100_006637 [Physocladia obscura]|uniref:NADPH:adrenodoxin oxidoreductase, mitochondrial n=1 Tax=Physocladia obscura TaxID=109957 RepID=A0AAD5SS29_9FUNG|nr:hypothetical protein HK100_006637 [Physocladia obscura]
MKIAIVGSGPAAFYTAQHLLKAKIATGFSIDMFEKLPMPYGLVRFGIAPDHADAKKVINKFNTIASEDPRFRFFGNVNVGRDISVAALQSNYDKVILAYGAEKPRLLGIQNETSTKGVYSAHDFVKWVNGYPYDSTISSRSEIADFDLSKTDTVVIVGQGNVALDVARLLLSSVDDLKHTDIPDNVLSWLHMSRIKRVHLVGRRGPFQMAFSAKELREMTKLPNATMLANPILSQEPFVNSSSSTSLDRSHKRLMEIIHNSPKINSQLEFEQKKIWSLDWFLKPHKLLCTNENSLKAIQFLQMKPIEIPNLPFGSKIEEINNNFQNIETGLLISSLGYNGEPIKHNNNTVVPFDNSKNIIPNINGRVLDEDMRTVPDLYVSGWIKRGAVGVVAATMHDAIETAESLLQDIEAGSPESKQKAGFHAIQPLLNSINVRPITYADWKVLDSFERTEGIKRGKEREKIIDIQIVKKVLG